MFEKTVIFSEDELTRLCREWQELLRLQQWNVKVGIFRARNMKTSESSGEVSWKSSSGCAVIRVLDPVDYDPDIMTPQDMEVTLVHELLHLRFVEADITESGSIEDRLYERAIQQTAEDMVRFKREAKEVST